MKKHFVTVLLCCILLTACASLGSEGISLDRAIQLSSQEIERYHDKGVKVAVLSFKSGSDNLSNYVIEELMGNIVQGQKLVVVDRNSLELIRQEMNFQLSGDVSDESAQEIGKMLGAQAVIAGSLTDLGEQYRFRIYTLNVQTAVREAASMYTVYKDKQFDFLVGANKGDGSGAANSAVTAFEGTWYADPDGILEGAVVTITGREGVLKAIDGNRSFMLGKGTITVDGNSAVGTVTHIWGNLFDELEFGDEWITLQDFRNYAYSRNASGGVTEIYELVQELRTAGTVSGNKIRAEFVLDGSLYKLNFTRR
jgi:TolB-like protein